MFFNYVDNDHEYIESVLNIYFTFAKPRSLVILPVVHECDIPQVLHCHIPVMPKCDNVKFEFPLDRFFTFALRSWR